MCFEINTLPVDKKNFVSKKFYLILFTSATLFYLIFIGRTTFTINNELYFTLVDDAMISMQYAKNFASGNGIRWNIHEKPVQGYTNFGWMMYMSFLHFFSFPKSKISLFIILTGLIILLLNIFVVKGIAEHLCPNNWMVPALASFCVTFNFPLTYWTLRGMEVGILCLLIDSAILLVFQLHTNLNWKMLILFFIISLLVILIRVDSILQISILLIYMGTISFQHKKFYRFLFCFLPFIVLFFVYIYFQISYFGDFTPNTYYAKVTGVSLLERLNSGIKFFILVTLDDINFMFLVITGILVFYGKKIINFKLILLLALFLVQCAYSIYVGGDYAEDSVGGTNRFITQGICPFIIVFSIVTFYFINKINNLSSAKLFANKKLSQFFFIYLILSITFLMSGKQWLQWIEVNASMLSFDIAKAKLGILIKKGTMPEARIAVHAAGQIPYYSDRYCIDMLGKNDSVIAKGKAATQFYPGHNKWNYSYSLLDLNADIMADEWGESKNWLENNKNIFKRLPNGIWVKKSSNLINIQILSQSYDN